MAKFAPNMSDPHGEPQTSPQHANPHGFLVYDFLLKRHNMRIGVLRADLRVAMWITHAVGNFRHCLLEKSLTQALPKKCGKIPGDSGRGQKITANFFLDKVFQQTFGSWTSAPKMVDVRTAQSQSLVISALTEPNRQESRRKKGSRAQKSQPEIANR